ncbi:restriction endonuclease subunit S [Microbacterium maritypicum]|uniref:restriction endonuclease subunit S n=1 Tax=Microbacterium maritypicum TaxID=33918 RepID=UPI00381B3F59
MSAFWKTATVGESIVPVSVAGKSKIQTKDYKRTGAYPIVDQGQAPIAGWTDSVDAVIEAPLPLIVFGDHSRTFKYLDHPFARGADGTQLLRPVDEIDPLFFLYACRAIDLPSRGYNRHFTVLKEMEIAFPTDKQVQRSVAALLKRAERAVVLQHEIVSLLEEAKSATMQQLFSRGLRGKAQRETEIGPIPENWQLRSIPDLCDIWSGGTPTKSIAAFWSGDIPWVSGKDLKRPVLDDATDHISEAGVANGSRLAPADSVLLLVRGMGLAKDLPVAVISRPMAFNQDVKALVSKHGYSGSFLRSVIYAGKDRLLSQMATSAHGTKTLNLHDLSHFVVPTPPTTHEAEEIASVFATLDRKIDLHQRKGEALDQLFKSLLRMLMAGEVSVEDLDLSALPTTEGSAA